MDCARSGWCWLGRGRRLLASQTCLRCVFRLRGGSCHAGARRWGCRSAPLAGAGGRPFLLCRLDAALLCGRFSVCKACAVCRRGSSCRAGLRHGSSAGTGLRRGPHFLLCRAAGAGSACIEFSIRCVSRRDMPRRTAHAGRYSAPPIRLRCVSCGIGAGGSAGSFVLPVVERAL